MGGRRRNAASHALLPAYVSGDGVRARTCMPVSRTVRVRASGRLTVASGRRSRPGMQDELPSCPYSISVLLCSVGSGCLLVDIEYICRGLLFCCVRRSGRASPCLRSVNVSRLEGCFALDCWNNLKPGVHVGLPYSGSLSTCTGITGEGLLSHHVPELRTCHSVPYHDYCLPASVTSCWQGDTSMALTRADGRSIDCSSQRSP